MCFYSLGILEFIGYANLKKVCRKYGLKIYRVEKTNWAMGIETKYLKCYT